MTSVARAGGFYKSGKWLKILGPATVAFFVHGAGDLHADEGAKNNRRAVNGEIRQLDDIDILLNQAEQRSAMFQKLMQVIPPELVPEELKTLVPAARGGGGSSNSQRGGTSEADVAKALGDIGQLGGGAGGGEGNVSHSLFDLIPVCGAPVRVYLAP